MFCLLSSPLFGQEDSLVNIPTNLLEDYIESIEGESFDYNTIFEDLVAFRNNKININKATYEDLKQLSFLTDIQVQNILNHREQFGDLIRLEELQVVPSIDAQTVFLLGQFTSIGFSSGSSKFKFGEQLSQANHRLYLKWERTVEEKKGYKKNEEGFSNYLGDPNYLYLRYRMANGNRFIAGFTAERDAGEEFFTGSNKNGFDFYSGFIYARDLSNRIKYLSLGDYSISLGQGLILHNGFGAGKSSYVMNVKRGGRTIRPYSSVNEINFFRGIATTIAINKNTDLTLFGSSNNLASSIRIDSIDRENFEFIGSIRQDGNHRTLTEILTKNSVTTKNAGGRLAFQFGRMDLAVNALYSKLSVPIIPSDELYKKFNFTGDRLVNTSLDYSYRYRNYNLFGELAFSDTGGNALLAGLLTSINPKVDISLVYRNYAKDYHVLNANAFAESSTPINEQGLYMGILVNVSKSFKLSSYFDMWNHPWLRFRRDAPSNGKEFFVKAEYIKKRKFYAYVQYRLEHKQENVEIEGIKIDGLANLQLHRLRFHFNNKLNREWEVRNRFELSYFEKHDLQSYGYLIFQDLIYKPVGKNLSFTARYCLFDTDGFESRIYAYENDILYEFAIPFFQNRGSRFYINTRYKINKLITAEFRYSRTQYTNIDEISSGNEEIMDNKKTDLKAQLKFSF